MQSETALKKNTSTALKYVRQAKGSLEKIEAMIGEGKYCPDIIQQLDSVSGTVRVAKRELLAGHLDSCVLIKMKNDKQSAIEELLKIYRLSE